VNQNYFNQKEGGMKNRIILFLVAIAVFSLVENVSAYEAWKFVSGIKEADMKELAIDPYNEGVFYAASIKRLYRSEDKGETWRVVFSARGDGNVINFINVSGQGVFVCTEKGVFKSPNGKSGWKRMFKGVGIEENNALHINIFQGGEIYLGTKGGLFFSSDNGATWKKDSGEAGNISITWIAFREEDIFLASDRGLYKSSDSGWRRVFVTSREESDFDSSQTDESTSAVKPVNSMIVNNETLYLATDSGIFISEDKGYNWKRFSSEGLLSQRVKRLLFKDNFYAATDEGVFVFGDKDKMWRALYTGMTADKIESMSADKEGVIWVATDKGLYKSGMKSRSLSTLTRVSLEEENVLELFDYEPSITDVQNAAIEYAEVHPDKIKEWRGAAGKKALLPSVSVGLDRYVVDYYHWDAGQNPDEFQKGDDIIAWDVTVTWKLDELIWNDDQTSIDTRSRLMVQLRDDILDEVTRTYFERRRLQIEMHLSSPSDVKERIEKELRMQELTADLDALTGGYFSE